MLRILFQSGFMTMCRIALISLFVFALSAALAAFDACRPVSSDRGGFNLDAAQPNNSERLKELRSLIDKEIGTPSANELSQCKLIAFGSKPCGGPSSYLVYSAPKTDESRLNQLVNEFNQLQNRINEEQKLFSDCTITPKPQVELVDGVCTAKPN